MRRLGGACVLVLGLLVAAGCGSGGLSEGEGVNTAEGKQLFTQRCGQCHELAAAGTKGQIGPNLDAAFGPGREEGFDESTIREIVRQQIKYPTNNKESPQNPVMPADLVKGDDVDAVAAYVGQVAGAGSEAQAAPSPGAAGSQGGTTSGGPAGGGSDGKQIFASAGCGSCHMLADAGSSGTVGPNLNESKPSVELAVSRVTNGMGAMPAFKGQLSETQIRAVAKYVAKAARK